MSDAAANLAPDAAGAKAGKKKPIVVIAVVVLALLLAAGGGFMYLKSKAAQAASEAGIDDEEASTHKRGKADAHPPTFLPLEPFVVNLADKDVDRYAQVGIVLEIDEATFAEKMKAYMPAIRNAILMILANKTSRDLLDRVGKEKLADEIMREIVRPLGIDIEEPEAEAEKPAAATPAEGSSEKAGSRRKPARKPVAEHNPVRHVHFSSFIVQ